VKNAFRRKKSLKQSYLVQSPPRTVYARRTGTASRGREGFLVKFLDPADKRKKAAFLNNENQAERGKKCTASEETPARRGRQKTTRPLT